MGTSACAPLSLCVHAECLRPPLRAMRALARTADLGLCVHVARTHRASHPLHEWCALLRAIVPRTLPRAPLRALLHAPMCIPLR
eukprot:5244207-Pleurochrysis_carterae.AAC.1